MQSRTLQILGTLTCIAACLTLYSSVLTTDWLTIQEPQLDPNEVDKLGPYDEDPKPHLLKARLGLLKVCIQKFKFNAECFDINQNLFFFQNNENNNNNIPSSELITSCVRKMRFTLPFIFLSVFFTSAAFLSLTFGHFCHKNKKIIEACCLILGGLCQATALLTFVSQIGSEFEANLPFDTKNKMLFYRYKYGYSFYLFLLSFSLSELAALLDMAAYFKKKNRSNNKNNDIRDDQYVVYDANPSQVGGPQIAVSGDSEILPNYYSDNKPNSHPDICCNSINDDQQQHHFNQEEVITITTNPYATCTRRGSSSTIKDFDNRLLESFATLRHDNKKKLCSHFSNSHQQQGGLNRL